jgi:RND family efflux transporter MFP subunit
MVRVPIFIYCAVTVALAVALSACRVEQAYEKPLVPVKVAAVETYADTSTLKYSGSVEPQSRTDLSFRVGGYVQQLATVRDTGGMERTIQDGDRVAVGTVLARLRDTDYVAKVNQARSALDQARAGLDQARFALKAAEAARDKARLDFDRASNLFNKQSLTKPELEGAKAVLDTAQANVDGVQSQIVQGQARIAGAQAQLDEGELALRDCALVAPSAGVALKRAIEIGSLVGPGVPAFAIMDVSSVKVVFGAPDVMVNKLRIGQTLPTTIEAVPGVGFTGRITRIAPAADVRSRVFDIEVTVANADGRLKPGMIATVEVQNRAAGKSLPVVPLPAVGKSAKDPKLYSVFAVERRGGRDYVHERTVQLGNPLGNRIAVLAGILPGENVVVSGTTLVRDGEAVQIIP